MSGRQEKAKRRASGLTSGALRGQREFEAQVAALKRRKAVELDQPIVSLAPKRRALAYACLALFGLAFLSAFLGSC